MSGTIHIRQRLQLAKVPTPDRRNGLTLLELLVVLIILAIVSTIAVNSLQPGVDASRFDQTQIQLENIRAAVQGSTAGRQADGTPILNGFVADMGRLPQGPLAMPFGGSGPGLAELSSIESPLAREYPFRFRSGPSQPIDYSNIQIPCGWRGPYLQLQPGQTEPCDGWGEPLKLQMDQRLSLQSVYWQPRPPYDQPLMVDLVNSMVSVTGTLNFEETELSDIKVVLLTPNPETSLTELAVLDDEDEVAQTFTFSQVPVGLRALHIEHQGIRTVRYLQVPYGGLSLVIDLTTTNSNKP